MDKWWNMELNRWEKPIWGKYDYSSFESGGNKMKYLVTCIIQVQTELTLYKTSFDFNEIKHSEDVKMIYDAASVIVKIHAREMLPESMMSIHQITVWRKNIYGGWVPVRDQRE